MADEPENVARWEPDPTGRHQLRYWDGAGWSAMVRDGGTAGTDAFGEKPSSGTASQQLALRGPRGVELRWRRTRFSRLGELAFVVEDADDHEYASVEHGPWGLKRIVIGEHEYLAPKGLRRFTPTFLTDPATNRCVARMSAARGEAIWWILVQDTPALQVVPRRRRRMLAGVADVVDLAGRTAMTITADTRLTSHANLGDVELGDWTVLVACLAFMRMTPSGGGG